MRKSFLFNHLKRIFPLDFHAQNIHANGLYKAENPGWLL